MMMKSFTSSWVSEIESDKKKEIKLKEALKYKLNRKLKLCLVWFNSLNIKTKLMIDLYLESIFNRVCPTRRFQLRHFSVIIKT